jgi:hypothetical protein
VTQNIVFAHNLLMVLDGSHVVKHLTFSQLCEYVAGKGYPLRRVLIFAGGPAYYEDDMGPYGPGQLDEDVQVESDFVLDPSAYLELVREDGREGLYPGVPILAFHSLLQAQEYLFFDDEDALTSIEDAVAAHGVDVPVSYYPADSGLLKSMLQEGDVVFIDGDDERVVLDGVTVPVMLCYRIDGQPSSAAHSYELVLPWNVGAGIILSNMPDDIHEQTSHTLEHLADFWHGTYRHG